MNVEELYAFVCNDIQLKGIINFQLSIIYFNIHL